MSSVRSLDREVEKLEMGKSLLLVETPYTASVTPAGVSRQGHQNLVERDIWIAF